MDFSRPIETTLQLYYRGVNLVESPSRRHLRYVYIGNVPGLSSEDLFCPKCGGLLIDRLQFYVLSNNLECGRCKF